MKRPMQRPELPEQCTLEDCVRWVMYVKRCSRRQARRYVERAINDGSLPFSAEVVDGDGKVHPRGVFRVRDGRVVSEH
jgi:hypothetical protein